MENQGISTHGLGLEEVDINVSTTMNKIETLKVELENTPNKSELLKRFLQLEVQVASRESVIAVENLRGALDQEAEETSDNEASALQSLQEAENMIE